MWRRRQCSCGSDFVGFGSCSGGFVENDGLLVMRGGGGGGFW